MTAEPPHSMVFCSMYNDEKSICGGVKGKRIGVYGGTFSPPHKGHVAAARELLARGYVDFLYIIPAATPPHKTLSQDDDPRHRLRMAQLAFAEVTAGGNAVVSDIELMRQGPSYTSDTLRIIAEQNPGAELSLLVGTDMFLTLDRWHEADVIFKLARIVCVRREDDIDVKKALDDATRRYRECFGADVVMLNITPTVISSTEIRAAISRGIDESDILGRDVYDYIMEHGLYGAKK